MLSYCLQRTLCQNKEMPFWFAYNCDEKENERQLWFCPEVPQEKHLKINKYDFTDTYEDFEPVMYVRVKHFM